MSSRPGASPMRVSQNPQQRRRPQARLPSGSTAGDQRKVARRASLTSGGLKAQRTSKKSQKLVVLPSAPQTKPLLTEADEDLTLGYEVRGGVREYKSQAERMTKEQREEAGFKRITAYCIAESLRTKLLASFLKREHNVAPRVFDEAMYVVYHLPLLPGYVPETNVRSSAAIKLSKSYLSYLSEAEEDGYQGTYFSPARVPSPSDLRDGYISSSSPVDTQTMQHVDPVHTDLFSESETEINPLLETEQEEEDRETLRAPEPVPIHVEPSSLSEAEGAPERQVHWETPPPRTSRKRKSLQEYEGEVGEVVFFEYGVVVFFGLEERYERDIIEDIDRAGILKRPIAEKDWEIEECHFTHDPHIAYPRIYNDFFTLKSRSHLLKLSISHALAQSTLLAHYETNAQRVLSSPIARSIPQQLALSGGLQLPRHDALKLTGRLFKLRRDVNLVSNVLDVPELFWSEASLGELYEAVREYMEIKGRVQVLNEKLGVASDFLDAIHDHLNTNEMTRITWTVIWLIVIAVLVELGEILARLVVHSTLKTENPITQVLTREDALRTLERMISS